VIADERAHATTSPDKNAESVGLVIHARDAVA
jgi:hypothetical protein